MQGSLGARIEGTRLSLEKENTMNRKDSKGKVLQKGETQRKDGRYVYRYTERGETRSIYAKTLAELRQKEKELTKAEVTGISYHDANKLTLNDVFDEYMKLKVGLKQNTKVNYISNYNRYLREGLGKRIISDIRYSDVKKFYLDLVKKGMMVSTLDTIHTFLHPTLQLAVRNNYIPNNPIDGVVSSIRKETGWQDSKRFALTVKEQQEFMSFVKNTKKYHCWLNLFIFFLGTGCRVGEVTGLTWDNVDFKSGTISIKNNLTYIRQENGNFAFNLGTTKTRSGERVIPMLPEVRKVLLEEKEKQFKNGGCKIEVGGVSNFVFINSEGKPHTAQVMNKAIKRIVRAYNKKEEEQAEKEGREPFSIRDFSVHTFRHTFCTRLCENELNVKVIQEIMGHAEINTTMDVYAEVSENKKVEVFHNLENKLRIC